MRAYHGFRWLPTLVDVCFKMIFVDAFISDQFDVFNRILVIPGGYIRKGWGRTYRSPVFDVLEIFILVISLCKHCYDPASETWQYDAEIVRIDLVKVTIDPEGYFLDLYEPTFELRSMCVDLII